MINSEFKNKKLSLLGFGTMRLPQKKDCIDIEQVKKMVDYGIKNGINYFDTAWPYHGGESEKIIGEVLSEYDRNEFYLATKFPSFKTSNPSEIFEKQLEKCKVDYFDFYLIHNVNEKTISYFLDPKLKLIDYLKEQKKLGRIKHLGFSCHGDLDNLKEFLDACGEDMEFCQIQLNYLDWTLQNAKEKYELLTDKNIPVWVMEPIRGGGLANLDEESQTMLKIKRPNESIPAWGFRFLQDLPNVKMILSGMSNMAQVEDNVKTFKEYKKLNKEELDLLFKIAENLKNFIPCTKCHYCSNCPKGIDIPKILSIYNEIKFSSFGSIIMQMSSIEENKKPSSCVGCGKCVKACPQNIDIPKIMKEFNEILENNSLWKELKNTKKV